MGVAESFRKSRSEKSVLCAVVIRSDLVIDGCVFGFATLGGDDATDNILSMYRRLKRTDINLIMTLGSVISHYNIIDSDRLERETGIPAVAVTFEESEGLEEHIREMFPSKWRKKLTIYRRIQERKRVKLPTGHIVFLRASGVSLRDATKLIGKFTVQGAVPEPLRVARMMARARLSEMT